MPKKFEDVIEIPKFLFPAKRGRPSKQELKNRKPHPVFRAQPIEPSIIINYQDSTLQSIVQNSDQEMAKNKSRSKSRGKSSQKKSTKKAQNRASDSSVNASNGNN